MKRKNILIIAIILVIQTILYVWVGTQKAYIHIDEAYSFGLANYDKIDIQNNEDFFNNWHTKQYYEDYLSVQKEEIWDFKPVYENQKNDVHPPLYYLLLKISMNFTNGHFSKWSGIVLNIIIYAFITIFMYFILKELLKDEKKSEIKAILLAFMSSIILASLSNVIYIRMYALSTLNILITTFLHIKLLQSEKINPKLLVAIGLSALAGSLTHYYYYFYLGILYVLFLIKYIKEKKKNWAITYTFTMIIAGILSIVLFRHAITHMFFGYRGQGFISKLENIPEMIKGLFEQIHNLNYYGFNNLLPILAIIIIGLIIYNKIRKKNQLKINKQSKQILKIITIPTIVFFVITSIASPWNVLRYIVPVCGLLFVLVMYYIYKLLQTAFGEKVSNVIISLLFCMILITPLVLRMEPELLYTDKKEVVQELGGELNLPTIYLYNSEKANFIDDILLFSMIDESYITKDIENTINNIRDILENKDISKGIILFISDESDNENVVEKIKSSLHFTNSQLIKKLNSCEVYYIFGDIEKEETV